MLIRKVMGIRILFFPIHFLPSAMNFKKVNANANSDSLPQHEIQRAYLIILQHFSVGLGLSNAFNFVAV